MLKLIILITNEINLQSFVEQKINQNFTVHPFLKSFYACRTSFRLEVLI